MYSEKFNSVQSTGKISDVPNSPFSFNGLLESKSFIETDHQIKLDMTINNKCYLSCGVSDVYDIINDTNELNAYHSLTFCRCELDGVFSRSNYYGLRYFDALAFTFIQASIYNLHISTSLKNFMLANNCAFPNEFDLSNILQRACDKIYQYHIFSLGENNLSQKRFEPVIDNLPISGFPRNMIPSSMEICSEPSSTDRFNNLIDFDIQSDVSNSSIGSDPDKRSKKKKRMHSLLRRRRSRRLEPIMRASGLNIAPKGVYATRTNTFRVQLNLKTSDNKFSRNVDTLHDALWLYEIKILSSDMPRSVEHLIKNGNFDSLYDLKIVSSPAEYLELLGKKIHELSLSRHLLNSEFRAALEAFNQIESM
jgi:hypothetical protein